MKRTYHLIILSGGKPGAFNYWHTAILNLLINSVFILNANNLLLVSKKRNHSRYI